MPMILVLPVHLTLLLILWYFLILGCYYYYHLHTLFLYSLYSLSDLDVIPTTLSLTSYRALLTLTLLSAWLPFYYVGIIRSYIVLIQSLASCLIRVLLNTLCFKPISSTSRQVARARVSVPLSLDRK